MGAASTLGRELCRPCLDIAALRSRHGQVEPINLAELEKKAGFYLHTLLRYVVRRPDGRYATPEWMTTKAAEGRER